METVFVTLLLFSTAYCAPDFSERARNFSIELLHYTQLETNGHVVISPFGVWSLMTGVSLGATGDSRTELIRALVLPKNYKQIVSGYKDLMKTVMDAKTRGVRISNKHLIFLDNGFNIKSEFKKTMVEDFGANIQELDFKYPDKAANVANSIIKSSSVNVCNVMQSNDFRNSRLILTNVITFKGNWSSPFNRNATTVQPFYDENYKIVGIVNMMDQKSRFLYSKIQEIQSFALELPYGDNNKYSMLILLPYPKVNVREVYTKLSMVSLTKILTKLEKDVSHFGFRQIHVKLPRFKISTNVVLNKPLNNMGVYDIFEPEVASFKKMTTGKMYISAIVHKANIEVTESCSGSGSVAPDFLSEIIDIDMPSLHVNRPFIYFVMEKTTATVIFSGIYSKPTVY